MKMTVNQMVRWVAAVVALAAAFCAAAIPSLAENWMVSENTTLTEDTTRKSPEVNASFVQ